MFMIGWMENHVRLHQMVPKTELMGVWKFQRTKKLRVRISEKKDAAAMLTTQIVEVD